MKQIIKITIKKELDKYPDLTHLGEFSNKKGKYPIEHEKLNDKTFNFFNANEVENMKQAKENYEIIMKYKNGELWHYGIKAIATIETSKDGNNWLLNTIESGGLWGIESGNKKSYFLKIGKDELNEIKQVLKELGFKEQEINKEIKKAIKNGVEE